MKNFLFSSLLLYSFFAVGQVLDEEEDAIGQWKINDGVLITNTKSKLNSIAKEDWKVFTDLFPEKYTTKYIKQLVLIFDGIDEKTGALGALNEKNTDWELVLDTTDVNFKSKDKERLYQSTYTLIHEFGHLLTLNNSQVKPSSKTFQEDEDPYLTSEGEALANSYINLFVTKFWNGEMLDKWDKIQGKYYNRPHKLVDKLYDFYLKSPTSFVTDYAAESPEEDIAESWTSFVFNKRKTKLITIADKKVDFFYQFPELVKLRSHIRKKCKAYVNLSS